MPWLVYKLWHVGSELCSKAEIGNPDFFPFIFDNLKPSITVTYVGGNTCEQVKCVNSGFIYGFRYTWTIKIKGILKTSCFISIILFLCKLYNDISCLIVKSGCKDSVLHVHVVVCLKWDYTAFTFIFTYTPWCMGAWNWSCGEGHENSRI